MKPLIRDRSGHITQWQSSNDALTRLLAHQRHRLGVAVAMAENIRDGIESLFPSMAALCLQTCRFCPEPCCITNTVWIDFRDLLLLHLIDDPVPARQVATGPGEACPFLNHSGCRLPWRVRPWMCVKYICPAQRAILKKDGRPDSAALYGDIDRIENQRLQMEAEVLHRIRPKSRTWPSSSSAWLR